MASDERSAIPPHLPRAPFVAHVIAQFEHAEIDPLRAARAYAAADALGFELPKIAVAAL